MIKIRPAIPEDAFNIATINIACWKTAYRGLIDDAFLDELSVTEKRIQNFDSAIRSCEIYLVAENETETIGYLSGGKTRVSRLPFPYEIYTFYVHPNFQRQGVGRLLISAFKEKIHGSPFCVYTLDGNTNGIRFYQKMGGVRRPEFDADQKIYNLMTHELLLAFTGEK